MNPPPLPNRDVEHLRLLAIFHYVEGGLSFLGIGFAYGHYYLMNTFFGNSKIWENAKDRPPFDPQEFMNVFIWFYVAMTVFFVISGMLNLISARCLQKRTHRTFSIVVAALNCLQMPLGTILGVFSLVVLTRESVQRLYERQAAIEPAPPSQ